MHQPRTDALTAAFDDVVRQVDRARAGGMRTLSGDDAAPRLERLRADVLAQRDVARQRGGVDPEWLRGTIRAVADWAPETDVTLLGALGALARARSGVSHR